MLVRFESWCQLLLVFVLYLLIFVDINKHMKLQRVEIQKRDTCYTYALKRVGHYNKYCDLDSPEFINKVERLPIPKDLQIGDILVSYNHRPQFCSESNSRVITEEGKLLFKTIVYSTHFYVYEGEGVLSDLTYDNRNFNYIRTIEVSSIDWDPEDFIIRLE